MTHLERQGDMIALVTSDRNVDLVKRIPGSRHDRDTGMWTLPLSWASCVAARGVFGAELEIGEKLAEWATGQAARHANLLLIKDGDARGYMNMGYDREGIHPDLYPFQKPASAWLVAAERALLTWEMGTGKTPVTAAAIGPLLDELLSGHSPHPFPLLVITTNSMKFTWKEELEKWMGPGAEIQVVDGTPAQKRKQFASGADIFIINWEALRRHSRIAPYGSIALTAEERTTKELDGLHFATVIADEVHRAGDPKSKQTRAWWSLSHQATFSYGLTGTPVRNTPADLWAIMHGLRPNDFPRKSAFVDRYCMAGLSVYGVYEVWGLNPATQDELFSFLDPYMFRLTKAEALPDLPLKTYSVRRVPMQGKQLSTYKALKKEMVADVDGEFLVAGSPLTLAVRLSQAAAATPILGPVPFKNPETGEDEERTGVVAMGTPSCKVDALLDILDEDPGAPVVVFAESRKLIDLVGDVLDKRKISNVRIVGGAAGERSQLVASFQDGHAQVALCTLGAGAEGITLTRAARSVFLQRSDKVILNAQAEDRTHRIGQKASKIEIIDIITADSDEDKVHARGATKEGYQQEVVRDEQRRAAN